MKQNNVVKLLGIALVAAIVSTGIFYVLFVSKLASSTGSGKTMVVAAKSLNAGVVLQATDLKTIPWPTEQLPKGAYGNVADVVGSTVFDPIGEDEPVMESRLANAQTAGGAGVPNGMRAVSVHVTDSTGVLALLRPGQKVDVQVVVTKKEQAGAEVRTALEQLNVLSVRTTPEMSSQGASLPVVTLLAQPSEADVLAAADAGARVRLTLRNPLDQTTRARAPLSVDTIMRSSGANGTTASVADNGGAAAPGTKQ
jgi:pilus assembly protein CpaB